MNILITNQSLDVRAGTELFTLEIARMLRHLGHFPCAYTSRPGQVAELLETNQIPVVTDIDHLQVRPDIIHGQHHLDTMTALLALPGVPAIYFCHGALPWQEQPPRHPRILHYATTTESLAKRLSIEWRLPLERITVFRNHVDLEKFRPRKEPLPDKPRRALVFAPNFQGQERIDLVTRACAERGVKVDFAGYAVGNPISAPEEVLPQYDVVFASGRSALEAMACGCGVILMDALRVGSFVTEENYDRVRATNFCIATNRPLMDARQILTQLDRFDPATARAASEKLRAEAGLRAAAERLQELYDQTLADWASLDPKPTEQDELAAAGAYFRWLTPLIRKIDAQKPLAQCEQLWRDEREKRRRLQEKSRLYREKLRVVEEQLHNNPMLRIAGGEIRKRWKELEP